MATPNVYFVYKLPDALATLQFDRTSGRYVFVCCLPRKYVVRRIVLWRVSSKLLYIWCRNPGFYITCERCVIRKTKTRILAVVTVVAVESLAPSTCQTCPTLQGRASQPVAGLLGKVGDFLC